MGLLSGFIGGAAQAGGEILQRERESGVRVKESQDIARFNDDLASKREAAMLALREEMGIRSEGRQDARTIATEQRGIANRATERGQIVDETVANAPRLRDIRVEDTKAIERAKYDPEIQELMRKAETQRLTAAEQAKLDFYSQNKTGILGQIRDTARAGHIDTGAGLRAIQMQSEQIKLDVLKADAKLPAAVKGSIAAIQKQVDAKSAALVKAELEGNANPEAVKKVEAQIEVMNGEIRDLYRPYLGDKAPKAPAAGGMQDVRVGGKVIGQAATPDEAAALVKQFKSGGAPAAAGPSVSGRPLYNAKQSDLQRMASKPRGVSTAEANEARDEMEKRKGESRMSGN